MEEKKAKEVEIKTKSPMWVVILVGVLVIALSCEFVYIYKLKHATMPIEEEQKNQMNTVKSLSENIENVANNNASKEDKKLTSINDEKSFNMEGAIYEYITEEGTDNSVTISYIVNDKHRGTLEIRKNNKVVSTKKMDKKVIEIKSLDYYFERSVFLLFEDGTVGKISVKDIQNKKYDITNVKNIENIIRIQELIFPHENYGADYVLVGVNEEGKIETLDSVAE